MKESLLEMLLNLFEKTLTELQEKNMLRAIAAKEHMQLQSTLPVDVKPIDPKLKFVKLARSSSVRIFTLDEQQRFTKISYQFLLRLLSLNMITADIQELIINRLIFSASHLVNLDEVKWVIRHILAEKFNKEQLDFLELVLYSQADELLLH